MAKRDSYTDLLIIGAGPAGLMAACWASQYAITTRLIDLKSERTAAGHADGINSRTMEILDSFGLADTVLRQAAGNMDAAYWVCGYCVFPTRYFVFICNRDPMRRRGIFDG